jgi:hypothetical protein
MSSIPVGPGYAEGGRRMLTIPVRLNFGLISLACKLILRLFPDGEYPDQSMQMDKPAVPAGLCVVSTIDTQELTSYKYFVGFS